ncbi:energy-coupling factor transporter transmembrane component T family protein [Bordetella holmesii]|uniref:Cobalt transport protein n=2 Tax=Bordetella holmesii TaxID=35814 RepID=A0A158M2Q1_9BORD|nr:energy-coupling factor transporter transmembrane protein EcfT [Bordetella holmesii]AHV93624.1 cobalt transport family protein [Bordetella holmesii ATCC 51541]AIT26900.1 cobalt transport family protein [Bordetella holmesii 44057]EWM41687.1 cobalt transport family protein [Bordetella holmesii 41130]EWM47484.1 cobalt transport family protein [Bordetella holmesii 35009]EWM51649.1 cobalt transport family protein [Bordetella holmesii 70147]
MMEPLYTPGNTLLHRLPAGVKLMLLMGAGVGLFALQDARYLGLACLVSVLLVAACRPGLAKLWRQVRGLLIILLAVAVFTAWSQDLQAALAVVTRSAALIALAMAVTLTTPVAALLNVIEQGVRPFSRWVDPSRVSLAFALCLRFVPEIWRNYQEIREAQAARGLNHHPLALLVPLIVRTLKRAEEVAQAIDARS